MPERGRWRRGRWETRWGVDGVAMEGIVVKWAREGGAYRVFVREGGQVGVLEDDEGTPGNRSH